MEYEEAKLFISRNCNAFSTLPTIVELAGSMSHDDALQLLGHFWSMCDNISAYLVELWVLIGDRRVRPQMMTDEERLYLASLPSAVTIYRGCGEHNQHGICWSLDRSVAERFPFLNRYRVERPLLVTAVVNKARIAALKLDRGEFEVITFAARRTRPRRKVEEINAARHTAVIPEHARLALENLVPIKVINDPAWWRKDGSI